MKLKFWQKDEKGEIPKTPLAFNSRSAAYVPIDRFATSFKEWTGACIDIRAKAISSLEWKIYQNDKEVTNHWLNELLERPNFAYQKRDFFELVVKYLDSTGRAIIWVGKNSQGLPGSMYVMPTNTVTPVFQEGMLIHYEIRDGGNMIVPPEEIIYLARFEPAMRFKDIFSGRSLVDAAIDSIETSAELSKFLKKFFANDGVPPLMLQLDDHVSQEQIDLLKAQWNSQLHNHKILAVVNGTLTPLAGSASISGSVNIIPELDKMTKQNIAAVFGVPAGKITGENQNKATADTNDYTFRVDTIEPLAYKIEEQLTSYFKMFDSTIKIKHVEYVYSDAQQDRDDRSHRLEYGLASINEERERLGFKPTDGGDVVLYKGIPLDNIINQTAPLLPAPTDTPAKSLSKNLTVRKTFKDMTELDKVLYWKSWNDIAEKAEDKLSIIWKTFITDIKHEVMSNLNNVEFKKLKRGVGVSLDGLFDSNKWAKLIGKYFDAETSKLIIANMKEAFKAIGENWDGTTSNFDVAIKRGVGKSTSKIKMSLDTITAEMKAGIEQAIRDNPNVDNLKTVVSEQLQGAFKGWENRADMIATTTATFVRGESQDIAWKSIKKKIIRVWISERDAKVRPSHRSADGQVADENGMFHINGDEMPYPCGGSIAGENVRCRCSVLPELVE